MSEEEGVVRRGGSQGGGKDEGWKGERKTQKCCPFGYLHRLSISTLYHYKEGP